MAVTLAIVRRVTAGNARRVIVDVTGPASYTTGGELLTAAQQNYLMPELGTGQALDMTKALYYDSETDSTLRSTLLDKVNNKVMFTTAGAQTGSTTNLSAVTIRCEITYGISTGA